MKKYLIYKVICPITNLPVYIGYTGSLSQRKRDHRCYTKSSRIPEMDAWKLLLKEKKLRCTLEIIENNIETIPLAKEREIYWIKNYTDNGYNLFNISKGGDLVYLLNSHMSKRIKGKTLNDVYGDEKAENIKKLISEASKAENNPNFGGKYNTPEWIAKQSKSNSKVPIIVHDKDNNFIGEFLNSKECAKFLGVNSSLVRQSKSGGYLLRHKYKITNKP